jgi:hypothetical protein
VLLRGFLSPKWSLLNDARAVHEALEARMYEEMSDVPKPTDQEPSANGFSEEDTFPERQLLHRFKSPLFHVADHRWATHTVHVRWTPAFLARDPRFNRFCHRYRPPRT